MISVVVPVYNAKPYLERCVNSILNQTYRNLEIILVDDGSSDGSGKLCDELAGKDNRIRVIHKDNGGSGSAKNTGVHEAVGEYIAFVDSDDWIQEKMYRSLFDLLQETCSQIAVCGIQKVNDEGKISYYNDQLDEKLLFSTEEALRELPQNERITNSMCNKLFCRTVFNGLKMNEEICYDDVPFIPKCIARVNKIAYSAEPLYCYYERKGSISKSNFSIREFDCVTADRMRLEFYHEQFPQCEDAAAIAYIGTCLKIYYQSAENNDKEIKERREQLAKELKDTIIGYPNLPFKKKQRAKAKLFLLSPRLFEMAMKLRGK